MDGRTQRRHTRKGQGLSLQCWEKGQGWQRRSSSRDCPGRQASCTICCPFLAKTSVRRKSQAERHRNPRPSHRE